MEEIGNVTISFLKFSTQLEHPKKLVTIDIIVSATSVPFSVDDKRKWKSVHSEHVYPRPIPLLKIIVGIATIFQTSF